MSFVLATAFGAGVWGLSPHLLGKEEPWDASLPIYFLSLLIGLMVGLLVPLNGSFPLSSSYSMTPSE